MPQEHILCGNGAADLIFRLVWAVKPHKALVTAPTFAEYASALDTVGCEVKRFFLDETKDFAPTDALVDAVDESIDMVFLCQPNNPTGQLASPELVKKLLRLPLRFKGLSDRKAVKRAALLFGNSVCCPSCTYNKQLIGDQLFESDFEFALDWDNLYQLACRPGRFVCSERPLIFYRVHPGATTKQCMEDNRRKTDETAMFRKMWPQSMVKLFMHFYKKAYRAYEK